MLSVNARAIVFSICTEISCPSSKHDGACEAGAMIEGNIPGTSLKNSYYCISLRT